MILGTIQNLCTICNRLITIVQAQQAELRKLGCNEKALDRWEREAGHLKDMIRRISK